MSKVEFLETIETIKAEEASVQRIFGKEGQGARHISKGPKYMALLAEAGKLVADVYKGRLPERYLREALGTDDFPYLFGDIIDRQVLANYQATPNTYRNFCKIGTVRDFRTVKRFYVQGNEAVLDKVGKQEEYPESSVSDGDYTYYVEKYGRRIPFAWETMINDDLDALKDTPVRFGKAAARTEQKFATGLYCDANGPHASFYTAGNNNKVTSNPVLSISALQTAYQVLAAQVDSDGEPIMIDAVHLVVPPALEVTANNILHATEIRLNEQGGVTNQQLIVQNWMKNRTRLSVDPYIPIVASTANGNTSWWLFADPGNGRPAIEIGFLRGHETPEIFIKAPNARRVGGGDINPMDGDFDTDSIQYKIRHVLGGTRMDPKMTVASNGSGS